MSCLYKIKAYNPPHMGTKKIFAKLKNMLKGKTSKNTPITHDAHAYTQKQKSAMSSALSNITLEEAMLDFSKLQSIGCSPQKPLSRVGYNFVNFFTFQERLETIVGTRGLNFYDVWKHRTKLCKMKPFLQKMVDYYTNSYPSYPEIKVWKRIFGMYYGSINIFRPTVATSLYCKYKPKCILDFTMGWGTRLVCAAALNIKKYIGVDNNMSLQKPYMKMKTILQKECFTDIELHFKDALTLDYSNMHYDFVFTSPPYYNVELYDENPSRSDTDWNENFYFPLFRITFKHLQKGGKYCLNVPIKLYDNACVPVLGKANMKIPLTKSQKAVGENYKEYIYIWNK